MSITNNADGSAPISPDSKEDQRLYSESWLGRPIELLVPNLGLAEQLYVDCFNTFQFMVIAINKDHPHLDLVPIKDCLGRFYLWGEGICKGNLDSVLEEFDELRESTLVLLGSIADILSNSKIHPLISYQENHLLTNYTRQRFLIPFS